MTAQPSSQAEREDVALLPCPFCDAAAIWREDDPARPDGPFGLIVDHARDCFPRGVVNFDKASITGTWNTRPDREHATPRSMPEEVVEAARPMDTAPRDGTMVRLLVDYTDGGGPLDDAQLAWTIGFNGFEDHGVDEWKFAGWCWTHDHFTQGSGTPVGWLPWSNPSTGGDEA